MLPPHPTQRRLWRAHDVEAQSHSFSTHCLRFTRRVAETHARLVSGRLLTFTGRESNLLDHRQGFRSADSFRLHFILPDQTYPVASWAHARRKFVEAVGTSAKRAKPVLGLIQKLYGIEKQAREAQLAPADRARLRKKEQSLSLMQSSQRWNN